MNYSLITGFHEILLPIRVAELWSFFFYFWGVLLPTFFFRNVVSSIFGDFYYRFVGLSLSNFW